MVKSNAVRPVVLREDLFRRALKALPYQEYLKTDWWQHLRDEALDRAFHCCQLCNSDARLEVHHRTYEDLGTGGEKSHLIVLCKECHQAHHDREKLA